MAWELEQKAMQMRRATVPQGWAQQRWSVTFWMAQKMMDSPVVVRVMRRAEV
jgi:hypothetical protein